jgi:WD40 repeat protein
MIRGVTLSLCAAATIAVGCPSPGLGRPNLPAGALLRLGTRQLRLLGGEPYRLQYSREGRLLATSQFHAGAMVSDALSGEILHVESTGSSVRPWALSADGQFLALGEKHISVFDLPRDRLVGHFEVPPAERPTPAVAPPRGGGGGVMIGLGYYRQLLRRPRATLSATTLVRRDGRTLHRWDIPSGAHSSVALSDEPRDVDLSPDGRSLLVALADRIEIRDAATLAIRRTISVRAGHAGWTGGRLFVVEGERGRVLDDAGSAVAEVRVPKEAALPVLSPDGRTLAAMDGRLVRRWDARSGAELPPPPGHTDTVVGIAELPNRKEIVTAGRDRTIRVWDAVTGSLLATHRLDGEPSALAVDAAGGQIAVARRAGLKEKDKEARDVVEIFDALGRRQRVIPEWSPQGIALSPSGRLLAIGHDRVGAMLVDLQTGRSGSYLGGDKQGTMAVAFSPDGTRLATGRPWNDGPAWIWSAQDGRLLHTLEDHESGIHALAFSSAGDLLASGGRDGVIRIWGTQTGLLLRAFHVRRRTRTLAFAPGRDLLAVGGDDLGLWDARTGLPIEVLEGHAAAVTQVQWSADGTRLFSASEDGTALVWRAPASRAEFAWAEALPISSACAPPPPPKSRWVFDSGRLGALKEFGEIGALRDIFSPGTRGFGDLAGIPSPPATSPVATGLRGVRQIAFGGGRSCVVHTSGMLLCWSPWDEGRRPLAVRGVADVVDVALGNGHGCARTNRDEVYCFGSNAGGQLGDGTVGFSRREARRVARVHGGQVDRTGSRPQLRGPRIGGDRLLGTKRPRPARGRHEGDAPRARHRVRHP